VNLVAAGLLITGLFSCASIPKGATAVSPFEKDRYLGLWYEIARKDFKFERNLNNTTAEYSLNEDGSIKVVNRGYNVIALDVDYRYALVAGKDLDLLWILSRETTVPDEIKDQYLQLAEEIGYDTSDLIWVEHNQK
jgi:apolipoprotein D and lipocalin family protein